jgi:hypothetical protein
MDNFNFVLLLKKLPFSEELNLKLINRHIIWIYNMDKYVLLNYLNKLKNKQNKKLDDLLNPYIILKKRKKIEITLAKELVIRMLIYIIMKKHSWDSTVKTNILNEPLNTFWNLII